MGGVGLGFVSERARARTDGSEFSIMKSFGRGVGKPIDSFKCGY